MADISLDSFYNDVPRAIDIAVTDGAKLFHQYDSYRAYSWLIRINGIGGATGSILNSIGLSDPDNMLTLAAKQVGQIGYNVDDIMVDRVNDKFYYPGRPSMEETVVTFDNLLKGDVAKALFDWMRTTYDPIQGVHSYSIVGGSSNKRTVDVIQLDHQRQPKMVARLYGCYPKNWRLAEFNYSANDFHSIEVSLRYDIVGYFRVGDSAFEDMIAPIS
tara:strand:- start:1829 stop:2476 length:648 start_codon:yes stop_codon:yes gene_type:complete